MTHVYIHHAPGDAGATKVLVNGTDITKHLLAAPFTVEFNENPEIPPTVTMAVCATDGLTVDLPDAVINAFAATEGGEA